jgi:hypothetical protein
MFTAEGVAVATAWDVGVGVGVVAAVVGETTEVGVDVECSRTIWNVPLQAVMARRMTTADKM